jgi:Tat protein translocase TatB subunit
MFNMGFTEIIVLSVIALLVIGPKQLPEVARVVGRMLNEFKRATGDISSSLAGVKREAQGFANQTQSYMQKQREDFEKKMKETVNLDEENSQDEHEQHSQHASGLQADEADEFHEDENYGEHHHQEGSQPSQMNFDLDENDSSEKKDS